MYKGMKYLTDFKSDNQDNLSYAAANNLFKK
jgi:hypothetical protein